MSTNEITNTEDVIDSRDIIARLEYLEDEMECYQEENKLHDFDLQDDKSEYSPYAQWEYHEEYCSLKALADEADGYVADWQYGEALIHEDYFVEYCEQLCEDIGYISPDFPSWIEVDWKATAENIKVDYTELDFDGVTYFAR